MLRKLLIFSVLFLIAFSCSKKKEKDVIPEKEMINILIDIHIADAILNKLSLFDRKLSEPESLSYYNQVFKKHKITREQFYRSFKYYMNDLDRFVQMYKVVKDSLSRRLNYYDSLEMLSLKGYDVWTLKRKYLVKGEVNHINFRINDPEPGVYLLSANIYIYPDDLSYNLRMTMQVKYCDSTDNSTAIIIIPKKETWEKYMIRLPVTPNKEPCYITGQILSSDKRTSYMHVEVKDISLFKQKIFDPTEKNNDTTGQLPEKE